LQNPRSTHDELVKIVGAPRVQRKSFRLNVVNAWNGWPVAFWHIRQWQMHARSGGASAAKRTAPHWQPPVQCWSQGPAITLS
jgi:hypothetical protein